MRSTQFQLFAGLAFTFMMASCSSPGTEDNTTGTEDATEQTTQPEATMEEAVADTIRLEIHGNDQMEYDKNRMDVKAGQVVVLTLKHVGELPENAMGHNWVLLQKGVDKAAFAEEAMQAKDNDYIPEGHENDIIVHTEMIGGGESDEITFVAPAKGIYDYICSFPGHYIKMKGKLVVE